MGALKTHILHIALYMNIQVSPSKQVSVYVFLKREAKWAMHDYTMIVDRLKEKRVRGWGNVESEDQKVRTSGLEMIERALEVLIRWRETTSTVTGTK